jgi:hypothetical protein
MSVYTTHYRCGREILAGDRIKWAGKSGTVLFVLGQPDVPADWASQQDWFSKQYGSGFMLQVEGIGLLFQAESDEDLNFLERSS